MLDTNRTSAMPVDPDSPRRYLSLDGSWRFRPGVGADWRIIQTPACWESVFEDLRGWSGSAVYERLFTMPPDFAGKRVLVRFDAVDYYAEVWMNGKPVGKHEGGYTPFTLDVTDALKWDGENKVTVRVTDCAPDNEVALPDGSGKIAFAEIPHGKQSWYTPVSGIWQSVTLEARPFVAVEELRVLPNVDAGAAHVVARISGPLGAEGGQLRLSMTPPAGAPVVEDLIVPVPPDGTVLELALRLPDCALWSPETPALYGLSATLFVAGEPVDRVSTRFGMRKIEARDGHVWLNGRPYFLIGVLDQDFYPQTIYTPPSVGYLRRQFTRAKEMGINLMRHHIKVPTDTYLDLCDEMGLLVWYEIPNGQRLTRTFRERARQTLIEMLERDGSHPSVAIKSIMNESWGINLEEAEQRAWLAETFDWAKRVVPHQLVVDNSACAGNFHVVSDLEDYHVYFSIPDHAGLYDGWVRDFAARTLNGVYSPHGDALRTGREPLILSEFGNWGLPRHDNVVEAEGGVPWWFETSDGITRPSGVLARFEEQELGRAFGDYNALADASQEQQWIALKHQIEEMRRHTSVGGYVITEFTDINWESNGLLDFGRNPKVFHSRLADLQQQDILIARPERHAYWSGESVRVSVELSRFDPTDTAGARLRWKLAGAEGTLAVGPTVWPGTTALGSLTFDAPPCGGPVKQEVEIELIRADGGVRARTTVPFVFAPAGYRQPGAAKVVWLHDPLLAAPEAADRLAALGYQVATAPHAGAVAVTTQWDRLTHQFATLGGQVLLVALDPAGLGRDEGGLHLESRDRQNWWGDWCSSQVWFDPSAFPHLPDTQKLGFEYGAVMPQSVLTHAPASTVLSGLFVGWLHNPAALVVDAPTGKGRLVATTFDILTYLHTDPIATLMFRCLAELG